MVQHRNLAHAINLRIACPHCGKQTRQTLGWLQGRKAVPCEHCGCAIDLTVEPYRSRIEERLRTAARVQAALAAASAQSVEGQRSKRREPVPEKNIGRVAGNDVKPHGLEEAAPGRGEDRAELDNGLILVRRLGGDLG